MDFPGFFALKRHEEKGIVSDEGIGPEKKTSRGGMSWMRGKQEKQRNIAGKHTTACMWATTWSGGTLLYSSKSFRAGVISSSMSLM